MQKSSNLLLLKTKCCLREYQDFSHQTSMIEKKKTMEGTSKISNAWDMPKSRDNFLKLHTLPYNLCLYDMVA